MLIEGLEDVSRFFAPGAKTRKKKQGGESSHHQNHVTFLVGDSYCNRDFPLFYLVEEDPSIYYMYFSHSINVWYLTYIYHKNKNQPYHT